MKNEQANLTAYSLCELTSEESEQINGGLTWAGGQGVFYQVGHWAGEIVGGAMIFLSGTTM
jgi:hypothetical protein